MSLSYRIQAVEAAIPFEDVTPSWRRRREPWALGVAAHAGSPEKLAAHAAELLRCLTKKSVAAMYSTRAAYEKLCAALTDIASGRVADPQGVALQRAVAALEGVTLSPPIEAEKEMLDTGRPDELLLDPGPEFAIGQRCLVLDKRLCWCVTVPHQNTPQRDLLVLFLVLPPPLPPLTRRLITWPQVRGCDHGGATGPTARDDRVRGALRGLELQMGPVGGARLRAFTVSNLWGFVLCLPPNDRCAE